MSPVEIHGNLLVEGNKIIDKSGQPLSLAGNSFFWSNDGWGGDGFYKKSVVEYLKNNWGSTIVRAAMGVEDPGGYLSASASNLEKVKVIVDAAIELGLYVIVDWHSHYAELYESDAIAFFTAIANEYGDSPNIIYEIYNEPLAVSWGATLKPYAEAVIEAIRDVDEDNLIVVGTPNWSQDVDVASADPIQGWDNIAYTLHFYAGTHGASLREKAQTALDNGVALFCTEWGTVNADGDGLPNEEETAMWMEFFRENSISHCNWAVNNKDEGSSVFKPSVSPNLSFSDDSLTESGLLAKSIILNWSGEYERETEWRSHYQQSATDIVVEFSQVESWDGGFNGNITITNNGSPVSDYTLGFTAPWQVTHFWNIETFDYNSGVHSVPVVGHDWLSDIPTGGSVTFGFTATGALSDPTNILWDGEPLSLTNPDGAMNFTEWEDMLALSNDDDDQDGYDNLIEFLMGTVPTDASSSSPLVGEVEGGYYKVKFPVDPKALNVRYRLEVSSNLEDWSAVDGDLGMAFDSSVENANGLLDVEWVSNSELDTLGEKFFTRLRVEEE